VGVANHPSIGTLKSEANGNDKIYTCTVVSIVYFVHDFVEDAEESTGVARAGKRLQGFERLLGGAREHTRSPSSGSLWAAPRHAILS
jgi:hypothetical protein